MQVPGCKGSGGYVGGWPVEVILYSVIGGETL